MLLLADQAAFGASSVLLVWMCGRWGGPHEAGAVAIMLVPVALAMSVLQGMLLDPLILAGDLHDESKVIAMRRTAATASLLVAAVVALAAAAVQVAGDVLAMMTIGSFFAVVQYVTRVRLISAGEVAKALISDLVFLVPMGIAVCGLTLDWTLDTLALSVAGWSLGALLSAMIAGHPVGSLPFLTPAKPLQALRVRSRFAYEPLIAQGAGNASPLLLAALAGTDEAGVFRTAQIVTVPILLVAGALRAPLFTWLVRQRQLNLDMTPWLRWVPVVCALGGLVLAGGVWILLTSTGTELFGPLGSAVMSVAPWLCVSVGLSTTTVVMSTALRAAGNISGANRLRTANGVALLLGLSLGVVLGQDAEAAAIGLVVADAMLLGWWVRAAVNAWVSRSEARAGEV